jgi:hypothetical protein
MESTEPTESVTSEKPRQRRGKRKRRKLHVPQRMAVPVRALWEHATEEDRTRAHRAGAAILEYWLGRVTKQEVAERLELPPLRIWQLSQQAISGMLAGLLVQPRKRGASPMPRDPEDDPKVLRKQIARLEEELEVAQQLIELLRELPSNRKRELPTDSTTRSRPIYRPTKRKARKATGKKKRGTGTEALPPGSPSGGGSVDPGDGPAEG